MTHRTQHMDAGQTGAGGEPKGDQKAPEPITLYLLPRDRRNPEAQPTIICQEVMGHILRCEEK